VTSRQKIILDSSRVGLDVEKMPMPVEDAEAHDPPQGK
jgi:hypothetical protein